MLFKRRLLTVLLMTALYLVAGFTLVTHAQAKSRERQTNAGISASSSAETTITISEAFMNALLDAVFTKLKKPSFPLTLARNDEASETSTSAASSHASAETQGCANVIVLEPEISGVKTAVRFEPNRMSAPLAFTGSYKASLLGCLNFRGWAETVINLEFNRERQTLYARVKVNEIHLDGVPPIAGNFLVGAVQDSIDKRVNPVEILQAAQLTMRVPIENAGGALRLRAREVRPEVIEKALRLHISYEFAREP